MDNVLLFDARILSSMFAEVNSYTDRDIYICSAELQLRNKFEILEAW